jgi:hypothetical protein
MENMEELNELLDFIKDASKASAYNLGYNILCINKKAAVEADVPIHDKIKTLDVMIDFFTNTEEYEKCAYLHSLKMEIIKSENENSGK